MDLKTLAVKYMKFHNNPLTKIELPPYKCFLDDPGDQKFNIEKYQNILENSLNHVRVDRRCARSKGEWIEDLNLCKVTKLVGPLLKNFGYQDKTGIYFYPEEALFLIEQNKLEMIYKETPVSIYKGYDLLGRNCSLKNYRVYKKLVGQGFKLLNKKAIKKFYLLSKKPNKNFLAGQKRKNDSAINEEVENEKIRKINDLNEPSFDHGRTDSRNTSSKDYFTKIFDKLRETAPKFIIPEESSKPPDYFGFLPSSTTKHKHEFNLYIREDLGCDFKNFEDVPNVIAICTNDNIAFYRFPIVNIPTFDFNKIV